MFYCSLSLSQEEVCSEHEFSPVAMSECCSETYLFPKSTPQLTKGAPTCAGLFQESVKAAVFPEYCMVKHIVKVLRWSQTKQPVTSLSLIHSFAFCLSLMHTLSLLLLLPIWFFFFSYFLESHNSLGYSFIKPKRNKLLHLFFHHCFCFLLFLLLVPAAIVLRSETWAKYFTNESAHFLSDDRTAWLWNLHCETHTAHMLRVKSR